jgi:alginate O-acetyltransferase complex protein AlgI
LGFLCGCHRALLVPPSPPSEQIAAGCKLFFYGYWDWRFLGLIFASTVIDYFVARGLDNSSIASCRKKLLVISLVANLGMLGFFKYFGFFVAEMGALLGLIGFQPNIPTLNIILPVGISFYTFQTMSYTIDVYYGRTRHTNHFLDFALYVSFFPQLIAGPIERSSNLLPQLLNERKFQSGAFSEGLYHILFGLFKKIVIADNMAPIVNQVFSTPTSELTGPEVVVGVYAFAFQIYGDFSGYSSIAQGLAKWLGINLSWNFKMPYFARNPSDFCKRR